MKWKRNTYSEGNLIVSRNIEKSPTCFKIAAYFFIYFRVRYVAGLIRSSVSCECPTFLVDVEEWTRVLFMAGMATKNIQILSFDPVK